MKGKPTVVWAAMGANFVIMVAKFTAAAVTGSSAMVSEGIHSLADTGNQGLLLVGDHRSRRPPDETHPFGYGQEVYFWSLVVSIVLFGLGGGLSFYEGISHVRAAHAELADPTWNYVVLAVAFVVELAAFGYAAHEFRRRYRGRPVWEALRTSKDPLLFVPLAEDAAALAGIVVAFLGVFLSHRLGMPVLDGVASMVIGGILAAVALFLAWETRGLLVGERMDERLVGELREIVEADPAVAEVVRVLTMHLGPDEILLNLEVGFDGGGFSDGLPGVLARLERRVREKHPRITRIFVEPKRSSARRGEVTP